MRICNPEKRLEQFWGRVDEKHIRQIAPFVKGRRVLDVGCGNGTTTAYLRRSLGVECVGIDDAGDEIAKARRRFPDCEFAVMNCENLDCESGYFDTLVLRDVLHHLVEDADFAKVRQELGRVAAPQARLIVFDPNVNFIVRTCRRLASHRDAECTAETAAAVLAEMGYRQIHHDYNTLYSLPLSGGYVGINFVPQIAVLQNLILQSEAVLEAAVRKLGLGRSLCWRYLLVGDRDVALPPACVV